MFWTGLQVLESVQVSEIFASENVLTPTLTKWKKPDIKIMISGNSCDTIVRCLNKYAY